MRTSVLFAWLLCTTCFSVLAGAEESEYHLFAEEGKVWETKVGGDNEYYGSIIGDTIIGGKVWKKVYTERYQGPHKPAYYAAVRDEGEKVYAIAKGSSRPRLLYDFSLKEGEMVRCGVEGNAFGCLRERNEPMDSLLGFPMGSILEVNRIDTVRLHDNSERRRFTFTLWSAGRDIPLATPIVWIEGLGSGAGPFSPWMPQPPLTPIPDTCFRIYYTFWWNNSNNALIIAKSDEFYELAPSGTALSSPLQSQSWDNTIYDLGGRTLQGKPNQGIYIENGQKIVRPLK